MAIGSFVDGVFRGMQARDTMENNKRLRKMEDTRFEREGEKHVWDRAKHELAMKRAQKAMAKGYSRKDIIRDAMAGVTPDVGAAAPSGQGMSPFGWPTGQAGPLSFGSAVPREISALPATGLPQEPVRLAYDPRRGLIPEGMA